MGLTIPNWLSDVLMALGALAIPFVGWLAWPKHPKDNERNAKSRIHS
jgi:hypothetical protein